MSNDFARRVVVTVTLAVGAGAIVATSGGSAVATQGQPVIAGQVNTATSITVVNNTSSGTDCSEYGSADGLVGCGQRGVFGKGTDTGVRGTGNIGVDGHGAAGGVEGDANNPSGTAYGVRGLGFSTGSYGVFGEGDASGVFGYSSTFNTTGVHGFASGAHYF